MLSDQEFREQFKPLQVPASYQEAESHQDKIIFALASLGEASSSEVASELHNAGYNQMTDDAISKTLSELFDKGLLNGHSENGTMRYNLTKIIEPNQGKVDPDLLAPGLD